MSMRSRAAFRRFATVTAGLSLAGMAIWLATPALARARATIQGSVPQIGQRGAADWPMHNLDLRNGRYSPLDDVNASNVSTLALKWSFDTEGADNIGQVTPLVVD